MEIQNKTKEELIEELLKLQLENNELKKTHKKDIAENKRALESLTESKEKFRGVFDSNMVGTFFWDADGNIIDANDAFLKIVGYSRSELTRGLVKWNELTPAEYDKIDEGKLKELAEKRRIDPYIKEYIHKSGRLIPIIISAATLSGSKTTGVAIILDITERKLLEARLRGLSSIVENSLNEIYVFDATTLKFIYVNNGARNNLGFTVEEITTLTPVDIKPEFTRDSFLIVVEPLLSGIKNILNFETKHQRKDGSTYPVNVYLQLSDFEGKQAFVAIILDISERLKVERELLKSEKLNSILFDHLPQRIFLKDENSNYITCNKNYAADLGITIKEITGKNDYDYYPAELADSYRRDDNEVIKNVLTKDIEEKYILNGIEKWARTIKVPFISPENKITGILGIFEDITERKLSEEKLTQERYRFKQILDNFPNGIYIVDKDYRFEYLNPILLQEFGDPGTRKCHEYFHDFPEACSWCQNRKVFDGEIVNWEWHSTRNDEYYQLVDIPLYNIDGSISKLEVFHKITEIRKAEINMAAILDREHFLANLIRLASVAIGVGYPDGSLGLCNLAFQNLTGYSEDELKNISWNSVLTPPEWLEIEKLKLEELHLTKKSVIYQKEYIHKTGKRIPIELVVHPFYDDAEIVTHYYAFITDITIRKMEEQELIDAKERAEESDRLKSAFLSNMSHEIRTPMNGILGFIEILKEPNLTLEEQQGFLQTTQESGERMLQTINSIVDISKIESGLMKVVLMKSKIDERLESIYKFFKPEVSSKELQFFFKPDKNLKDLVINTDHEKICAILTNLIKNAIKFTYKGSIEFGYVNKGKNLEFFVQDTGIGIPKNQQEIIFERFRQGSESLTRNYEGSGLGLSISKSYVKMLKGSMWVESEEEKGSIFYFTIPFENEPEEININENFSSQNDNKVQTKKLKILIVEDDKDSNFIISRTLKSISYQILSAKTGVDAINACQNNTDIDLVMMDIRMPDMDGYEATRQIRQFNKDVIIIAQTAYALSMDKERALDAGCNEHITKPINKALLLELIYKHCNI